jgi:WXG100 family type VII secretion target
MATTRVTAQKLHQLQTEISSLISQYQSELQKLYTNGQELDSMWNGDANNKWNAKFAANRVAFDNLATLIQKYVSFLAQAEADYARAEEEVSGIVSTNKVNA